jgi:hypothetical protein
MPGVRNRRRDLTTRRFVKVSDNPSTSGALGPNNPPPNNPLPNQPPYILTVGPLNLEQIGSNIEHIRSATSSGRTTE